jgi:hypothetical protein
MPEIEVINLCGRPGALVAGDRTIVADHVPDALVAHVQAKALYAIHIRDGELPGPYTDAGAERYAAAPQRPPPRRRPRTAGGGRRSAADGAAKPRAA